MIAVRLGAAREDARMWEADALLNAIFDNPDDDTPRLVYADWLQEHDQENYAQFIRLQCSVAHCKMWSDEANDLWEQIGRAWNRLAEEWWPATVDYWPGIGSPRRNYCLDASHFHRGFLRENIPIACENLIKYPEHWPWLPTPASSIVEFTDDDDMNRLASVTLLRRLRTVRFDGGFGEGDDGTVSHPRSSHLNSLLSSPHLHCVRVLDLSGVALERTTADLLLTLPNLASVEELAVRFEGEEFDREDLVARLAAQFKRVSTVTTRVFNGFDTFDSALSIPPIVPEGELPF